MNPEQKTLVVGVGSSHGDDRAGWRVVEQLQSVVSSDEVIFRIAKSPIDLLDWLDDCDRLILCDACHGLSQIGQVQYFSWPSDTFSDMQTSGTHNFSLAATLLLAHRLNRTPDQIGIWVVEGDRDNRAQSLSDEVEFALPKIVEAIQRDLTESTPLESGNA